MALKCYQTSRAVPGLQGGCVSHGISEDLDKSSQESLLQTQSWLVELVHDEMKVYGGRSLHVLLSH